MSLIDEVKKLRDECLKEENYYQERFNLWMQYKGDSWPDLPSDSSACQSVGAIRSKLDRIIAEYQSESESHHGYWVSHPEYYSCSKCGSNSAYMHPYCPYCGAKMDAKERENK